MVSARNDPCAGMLKIAEAVEAAEPLAQGVEAGEFGDQRVEVEIHAGLDALRRYHEDGTVARIAGTSGADAFPILCDQGFALDRAGAPCEEDHINSIAIVGVPFANLAEH